MTLLFLFSTPPAFAQSVLPSNLNVTFGVSGSCGVYADQSPTFRQQLLRVGAEDGLTIHIDVVPRIIGARATTRMVRQNDGLTAHVKVARFDNLVELIAHEVEHVIEQIEGVNLDRRGRAGFVHLLRRPQWHDLRNRTRGPCGSQRRPGNARISAAQQLTLGLSMSLDLETDRRLFCSAYLAGPAGHSQGPYLRDSISPSSWM